MEHLFFVGSIIGFLVCLYLVVTGIINLIKESIESEELKDKKEEFINFCIEHKYYLPVKVRVKLENLQLLLNNEEI